MQKNLKQELKLKAQKHLQEQFTYVPYITCPDCNSHYLRCPDEQEFRILVNNKKVDKRDSNYTNICEECSKVFVERFEDNDPEFLINEELYYARNDVYE